MTTPSSLLVAAALLALAVAACASAAGSSPAPTIPPDGGPSPGCGSAELAANDRAAVVLLTACIAPADESELRLQLIDRLGQLWFCDPDEYPVAHGNEQDLAIERYPDMVAEHALFTSVAARLAIDVTGPVTDAQKLAIYQLWKAAQAIQLNPVGEASFEFDYLARPIGSATQGTRTAGVIGRDRTITVQQQAAASAPMCPICLARGTMIDTPIGPIAVEGLRLGDPIWTRDSEGRRVAGTVIALGSTTAPANHHVIRLTLADGRSVTASRGHPLADGRELGVLAVGDVVDGSAITALDLLPYSGGETFDLVASGATGGYYSDGIPLGTTLLPTGS